MRVFGGNRVSHMLIKQQYALNQHLHHLQRLGTAHINTTPLGLPTQMLKTHLLHLHYNLLRPVLDRLDELLLVFQHKSECHQRLGQSVLIWLGFKGVQLVVAFSDQEDRLLALRGGAGDGHDDGV